ncbi:adenylate kinase [Vibrio profundum]|uniref:adenylate kinase n=1 Tax=Vibrio profundum TaxID=2910247 RepID=UPI003D1127ED
MDRINVVGTSGSGKSTFAKKLAEKTSIDYHEMDGMYWKPNWIESTDEELFQAISEVTKCSRWVLDGNYHRTVPIKWQSVDTVIWLDYSFQRTVFQAIRRAISRVVDQEELWPNLTSDKSSGNRETFKRAFMSRDSIILWTLKTYKRNRCRYQALMSNPDYQHIRFIQLRSPAEAKRFLNSLNDGTSVTCTFN